MFIIVFLKVKIKTRHFFFKKKKKKKKLPKTQDIVFDRFQKMIESKDEGCVEKKTMSILLGSSMKSTYVK